MTPSFLTPEETALLEAELVEMHQNSWVEWSRRLKETPEMTYSERRWLKTWKRQMGVFEATDFNGNMGEWIMVILAIGVGALLILGRSP